MKYIIIVLVVLFTTTVIGQTFDVSAELRSRYENKHGYQTMMVTDADGADFISQRTRMNFGYKNEQVQTYISMQNVRVWGDVSTLSSNDNTSSLHEAWANVKLTNRVSLKLGRQEIVYDDHRIFGSVDWAQQARSHDAFIVKHDFSKKTKMDVGFAINADTQSGTDVLYSNIASYKNFQYLWFHTKINELGVSFLGLNTGIEYLDANVKQQVANRQTVGTRLTYKKNKLGVNTAIYFQAGKVGEANVSALYYIANLDYKVSDNFKVSLGYEYLSGKDQDDVEDEINTFAPLFGTNHKFNGWMDYFYVGYGNPTGLQDINTTFSYNKGKFSAKLIPHIFSATADVYDGTEKMSVNLGTEIDFTLGYKLSKNVKLNAGYSQMFASETMEVIKSGDKSERNSWTWVMFTIKPKLFSHTMK